jgi:toxin-antitoxin system PIN domain toxin
VTFLLDTNVLLALVWEPHQHHTAAVGWMSRVERFATCPFTQGGFLRISSNPSFPFAVQISDAFAALESLSNDARHEFWQDDISFLSPQFNRPALKSHGQVTDLYLLTVAVRRGATLATFDTNLANAFSGTALITLLFR